MALGLSPGTAFWHTYLINLMFNEIILRNLEKKNIFYFLNARQQECVCAFFNTLFNQMSKKRENEKLQKFTAYLRCFISQNNAIKNHICLKYGFVIAFETSNKCLVKHFLTTLNNILRCHENGLEKHDIFTRLMLSTVSSQIKL